MRASLGFHAGPLHVSTGNLLATKKRKHSGGEIMVWIILTPFVLLYFVAVILWWLLAVSWRRTPAPADVAPAPSGEPADDPAWTPRH